MWEKITCYSLENTFSWPYSYDRDLFYEEESHRHEQWLPWDIAIGTISIILLNESWELIIQKRANHKNHNPWLLDKSIGGHIQWWDQIDYTVMLETVQELQVPSIVVKENDNFVKTYSILKSYLSTVAILKHIETKIWQVERIIKGKTIHVFNKSSFFLWVYGWSIKNVDKEAKGILFYDLEDLIAEMKEYPKLFTHDLHVYIEAYEKEIINFIKLITTT